jgi:ferredoxin
MSTTFEVRNEATGESFAASEDRPLLQSALDAGLDVPSSCRNGTCRTCMQRLVSGRVRYRIEWPGLTPDEKEEGWILPCVAYPQSDLRVSGEGLSPWWKKGA